ncbi:MAG TPA: radical SAM protein [Pyrinomonadaceae bacterium]|nr:radical SAM protein [Pyrinomonadaceae bacterium]
MGTTDITVLEDGGRTRDYGPPRLIIELTNICNLHCSYCLRDEDALYHTRAEHFSLELLDRVIKEAREAMDISHVMFTGGETTLHPQFREVIETVGAHGLKCSFVTNGWHFGRVWPAISANREVVTHAAFSMDGATREAHDRWRGADSFVRLVRAFSRCRHENFPFVIKTVLRKDTVPQLESIAIFAARMGASALNFGHLLPTSPAFDELALDPDERTAAEQEVALLARVFKMRISLEVGYYNIDPAAPCSALASRSCNIDYRGRLSLCCNLSGYRGAEGATDIVGNLNEEPFSTAFERLKRVAEDQVTRRYRALADQSPENGTPDMYLGSPCLFCLKTFGKIPWQSEAVNTSRALPVVQGSAA